MNYVDTTWIMHNATIRCQCKSSVSCMQVENECVEVMVVDEHVAHSTCLLPQFAITDLQLMLKCNFDICQPYFCVFIPFAWSGLCQVSLSRRGLVQKSLCEYRISNTISLLSFAVLQQLVRPPFPVVLSLSLSSSTLQVVGAPHSYTPSSNKYIPSTNQLNIQEWHWKSFT